MVHLLTGDSEFDAELCFLLMDGDGRAAGFAHCWTSAFIKDLAAAPDWRGRGVGGALLNQVFATLQTCGAQEVRLKVVPENAHAIALYERWGMVPVDSD